MKTLILFLILTASAFGADNWFSTAAIEGGAVTAYPTQEWCMKASGGACYLLPAGASLATCSLEEYDIQGAPIYSARTNETDCIIADGGGSTNWSPPENDCRVLMDLVNGEPVLCTDKTYSVFYALKSALGVEGEGYFAYCAKITGYESLGKAKRLVVDPVKLAAVQKAEKQASNRAARDAFTALKMSEAEAAIALALKTATGEDADYTTHIMYLVNALKVKIDPAASEGDKAAADALIAIYNPMFAEIQSIRSARDAAIAAFSAPNQDVDPLY